ncbi:hypothetical protein UA08_04929 [Talaromyces atroroseus]|uniref:Uncharacterized protein n=1 Tax=Talaromyces atroroseus TaxID=1441469 RepID=A0A225ASG4_TALAT|nr:hypothetical protein UA08_04929 [Talaromyces atroroseus]OKL60218.1 hypothetical protein UA08_04929 [Talaromyces atroroseus]
MDGFSDIPQMHAGSATLYHDAACCQENQPQKIAIIGYACRLPGNVSSPTDLWELCTRKRSGWSPIPKDRFASGAFHHPNPSKVGTFNPTGGYFLQDDIARFDAPFFNITAQEAISMDPQQRLLLECSYEAVESAGLPKESLAGRNVGVFVGGNFADYELRNVRDVETIPMYQSTGCAPSLQSNRLSYYFDFRGPSFTVDTACSSSLVALHAAVQSLRNGESTEALVAGCRLNIVPDLFVSMSMSQLFNDEGKTYAFDNRATSGFARGEGAGVVILKLLDDALRDKDPIRAVIVHSGVSQDGRTQGITLPNGRAQEELVRRVYREAHINPVDCGFVEMHGTGTKVGDPIEASGVHGALGGGRSPKDPLYIGSVKSNVGHLEGASGIISLIKSAMILDYDLLLPNAEFKKANEKIPLNEWNMKVVTSTRPWPRGKKYISVSNYGFGGTNAHVVLEKAPLGSSTPVASINDNDVLHQDPRYKLIFISANDKEALQQRIKDFGMYFEQRPEVFEKLLFGNFAYTLGSRLSQLPYRVALPANSLDDLGIRLAQLKVNSSRVLESPRVGYVFSGQGAQWAQMGLALIDEYPVFRTAIQQADDCLRDLGASFSLVDELRKDSSVSLIDCPEISQPACTAIQIAIVTLLKSWGIRPSSVVGHSSGEIAAAFAAGIYDSQAAMALSYHRGQMTRLLKESYPSLQGGMIAAGAEADTIRPMLKLLGNGYATVACVNSPTSVTVSGDLVAIDELESVLQAKQIFNRRLKIDVAYHSDHMKRISEDYLAAITSIHPKATVDDNVIFYSSVLAGPVDPSILNAAYWVRNLVSPVLFPDALTAMCKDDTGPPSILIEIGPHSALKGPIGDTLKYLGLAPSKITYASTIVRKADAVESLMNTAAITYVRGATLDSYAINFPCTGAVKNSFLTDLPRYPWQHNTRYWHESRIAQKHQERDNARNDVLGVMANYSNDREPTWRNIVRLDEIPWLRDHKMQGMVVYPLAGYLAMAIEAAGRRARERNTTFSTFELREVLVESALVLNDDVDVETTISLRPYDEGTRSVSDVWDEFRIHSWSSQRGWIQHCRGLVGVRTSSKAGSLGVLESIDENKRSLGNRRNQIVTRSINRVSEKYLYQALTNLGADYGPTFQGLENCSADSYHSYADLHVRDTTTLMPRTFEPSLIVHPAFLDGLLHLVWPILGHGIMRLDTLYMPTLIKHATINRDISLSVGQHVRAFGTGSPNLPSPQPTSFDLFALADDTSSDPLIMLDGLVMTPIRDLGLESGADVRKLCYELKWQPFIKPGQLTNGHGYSESLPSGNSGSLTNGPSTTGDNHDNELANGPNHELSNGMNGHGNVNGTASAHDSKGDIFITQFAHHVDENPTASQIVNDFDEGQSRCLLITELEKSQFAHRDVIIIQSSKTSLRDATAQQFEAVQAILLNAARVLWVYQDYCPDAQMSVGLARSVRSETMAKISTLGIDTEDPIAASKIVCKVVGAVWPTDGSQHCTESEFKSAGSQLFVIRALEDEASNAFVHNEISDMALSSQLFHQPGRRLKLKIANAGSLDTLYFDDDSVNDLDDDSVEIEIKATGINFKDVVVAMGQLSQPYIGVECSGVITSVGKNVTDVFLGQRVMATPEGAYSTYTRCPSTSVAPIPDSLTDEEAATIPIIFCTAYYALFDLGNLAPGERLLIHAGAGGVGQAAIQLAQMVDADIFVTVGSREKKQFLMQQYNISEDRILYSRDASFGPALRRATNNEGVDVVLNSLAGDLLRESWECVAPFGRFIEIGKADITKNTRLEMLKFEHNVTFASVDLTKVAKFRPKLMKRLLNDVSRLVNESLVKPVFPITRYSLSEIEAGFRALQTGKNIGKSVVIPNVNDKVKAVSLKTNESLLKPDATYLIIGGTGGLGRSMAAWMSSKGARWIVLVSRSGSVANDLKVLVDDLALRGTQIVVKSCDVSCKIDVERLVNEEIRDLPPICGVVHGAMILRSSKVLTYGDQDMLFENMTFDDFQSVSKCKVEGAWNLHHSLARSPLDFFIALSSVAGVVGNRGQAAYSAANVFLDGFMEYRRCQGLPGTSIDLAAVTDVGYLANSDPSRRQEVVKNIGGATINESEVLSLLALAISGSYTTSGQSQIITGLEATDGLDSFWLHDSKFTVIRESVQSLVGHSLKDAKELPLRIAVKGATSKEEAVQICYSALATKLATVLGIAAEDMDTSTRVSSLGLDSLVAIEIRNWIAREADANIQVLELLSSESLVKLAELILSKSKLAGPK